VDELAPQLGLSPATPEEQAEVRQQVEAALQRSLPAVATGEAGKDSGLPEKIAAELVRGDAFAEHAPAEVEGLRLRISQRVQEALPGMTQGTESQRSRRYERTVTELTSMIVRASRSQDEGRRKVVEQIKTFIFRIHSGALGLTGTVALVFVAIGLLSTIEGTFNDIWGVPRGRNWFSRVIYYWAAITLGPLIIILMMGLAIGSEFQTVKEFIDETPVVGGLFFQLLPFFVLCGSFQMLYQWMPNTRVSWKAALAGAVVASVLWIANGKFNAVFASKVVSASKIYGSLGAVPILLFGLYLSWTILLFGAQGAYAFQNRRAYVQEKQAETVNQHGREFVALRVMTSVAECFTRGDRPPTTAMLAESLSVSSRLISQTLRTLVQNKLLVEVATPEAGYCPARPLDTISYHDILRALRAGSGWMPPTRQDPVRELVRGAFDSIRNAEDRVARDLTLQEMVNRAAIPPSPGGSELG
jgi:membrane protein